MNLLDFPGPAIWRRFGEEGGVQEGPNGCPRFITYPIPGASFVWIHSDLNCRALWGPQPTLLHPMPRQPLGETLDPKQCSLRRLWTPDHTMPVSAQGRDRRSACGDLLLILNCPENKRLPMGKAKKSLIFGFRVKGRSERASCTTSSSPRAQLQMPYKSWPSPVIFSS